MSANKNFLDLERQKTFTPRPALFIAVALAVMIALIFLHLWTRARSNSRSIQVLPPTAQFSISEMIVVNQGKVTVYMPPDATDREGRISIAPREPNLFVNAENSEWMHSDIVNVEFVNREGAMVRDPAFFLPLEICYNLTEEEWQAFIDNPGLYQIHHYLEDENPPRWDSLLQVTRPEQFQLCGQTNSLSVFSLAIRAQVPVTGTSPTAILNRTLVPTRTPVPGSATRERHTKEPTAPAPTWTPVPTNVPPTDVPPTQIQPTNPPLPTIAVPTRTPRPTNTPTRVPTNTPRPTNPPTNTPRPTDVPTNTPRPTDVPTNTPRPTDVPPTDIPPTDVPPTDVPTDVPPEPTATEPPAPTEPPTQEPPPPTEPATLLDLLDWWLDPSG